MLEIRGFITNLGKYNEGHLIGEWVTFPIDEEELKTIFEKIGINEEYEEFFFTDWDCEINLDLGEQESISKINEMCETLGEWDEEKLKAVIAIWGLTEALAKSEDDYNLYDDVQTDYDLGYYWIEESGCYDFSKLGTLSNYIDYEAFGRDVRFESNGCHTQYGFIECVG